MTHLSGVELFWFVDNMDNQDVSPPWSPDDPNSDFRVESGETVESIAAEYREACTRANYAAAQHELDDITAKPGHAQSLRWIYMHMIWETVRHAGHADILRELTDGATGE